MKSAIIEVVNYQFKTNINVKTKILNLVGIRHFLYAVLVAVLFTSCDYRAIKQSDLTERLERAYFEGQRDYANGDKRIEWTKDSCWVWIKSPWDSGNQPIYNPSLIHSRNGNGRVLPKWGIFSTKAH